MDFMDCWFEIVGGNVYLISRDVKNSATLTNISVPKDYVNQSILIQRRNNQLAIIIYHCKYTSTEWPTQFPQILGNVQPDREEGLSGEVAWSYCTDHKRSRTKLYTSPPRNLIYMFSRKGKQSGYSCIIVN